MKKGENKESNLTLGRTLRKENEPIQLSGENVVFKRRMKWGTSIPEEYLFIVPWQQIS